MAHCEFLKTCPFFNDRMQNMPAVSRLIKASLCQTDNSQCARHLIVRRKGRAAVPRSLFPDDHVRARAILATP